ncbi:MAG: beta-galactosidase [Actinomycetaceae bacterium]|nr:beta-galactosidase [Actinomycetaceae bacterium]
MSFAISDDGFILDGQPTQIISGALHYFRVHPSQWAHRLDQAVALGLNTIETYVAWNFHSSKPGEFRLDGWRDLGAFLDLAAERGLKAIVRPGPYICAEWDNAGLPSWLTASGIKLRTSDPRYLAATKEYFKNVLPIVQSRQVSHGGNVIMVQVENEYGAFGEDKEYLRALADQIRAEGIDVPLCTCDQANEAMLERGSLPELLTTATFGSHSPERLGVLRRFQPNGPLMCMEYWNGWFDSWGQHHHVTDPEEQAEDFAQLLGMGASVNLYMFHGGTNFGLMNGANHKGTYSPITTSYDYDAPLAEDGTTTEKYNLFQQAISSNLGTAVAQANNPVHGTAVSDLPLFVGPDWKMSLTEGTMYKRLPSIDEVSPTAKFMIYETEVNEEDQVLIFEDVRDRAYFFLDGESIGSINRLHRQRALTIPRRKGRLTVIAEDLGRVNYDKRIGEEKGLIGPCHTATRDIFDWKVSTVDLDLMSSLNATDPQKLASPQSGPIIATATFNADEGRDLHLDTRNLTTGIAWCNGFLLGRYWAAGPTDTLYIPGPLIKANHNSIMIWELEAVTAPSISLLPKPLLGHTEA